MHEVLSTYGLMNLCLNVVQVILKAFLVWLCFQIWADVRLVKDRQQRYETWTRRRDWEEAEQEQVEQSEGTEE